MKVSIIAFVLALSAGLSHAQVTVTNAWIRGTVPVQKSTGAFMQLESRQATRLVAVTTPVAERAELHQMSMQGDMMKMQEVSAIELAAGKKVELASGGYHIMLMGLKQQMKEGDKVPLTLTFAAPKGKKTTQVVEALVKPLTHQ
jgi:periplasmic copper chaperone A